MFNIFHLLPSVMAFDISNPFSVEYSMRSQVTALDRLSSFPCLGNSSAHMLNADRFMQIPCSCSYFLLIASLCRF